MKSHGVPHWFEWNGPHPDGQGLYRLSALLGGSLSPGGQLFKIERWHWFFDEPWSPWVVRVCVLDSDANPVDLPVLDSQGQWRDINLAFGSEHWDAFGDELDHVLDLFQAASAIGLGHALGKGTEYKRPLLYPRKLVHCVMNAWGYNYSDEAASYGEMAGATAFLEMLERTGNREVYEACGVLLPQLISKRGYFGW